MSRLQTQTDSVAANRIEQETKVVESRENGQYKRVTEVFIDDALFSRKTEVSVKDNGKFDLVHTTYFQGGKKRFSRLLMGIEEPLHIAIF